ncbi:amino acid/amide ABC transporter ATP-binding protein 2, HAAT family (TC 3.A.1.4.-) [Desulfofundulus australicus DSM 11792]|jgi:branched-chain amino acid transport system ATP-binding protein|uniref:Amino acid/amide ABC transporter ATP-binding protein 2, HAAT family (TC 3.A.1.4.-) n=1 Tax=Desulfofundulus australicus DSM 11792 TaxID=1121425 RepID=A0A1M4SJI7_9FIRM|nr:ABC transporter ATP-binding protein [Desulfofundulus australicus]MDK2888219.1 branched-chain amino acid transport system ATP-binding protein [Thermoanaerobacter sp.]SHE32361.1 amino acid/amide ABC transporter ATP-binding protein 2, HAAT family (TC 3.A.1.4.-) [Desulfofundulus australicus DSM 11792]
MALLEIDNISVYYGEMCVLRDVSAQIDSGEIICVVGANGAGKSTLINTISGLLKPKTGKILFNGEVISKLEPYQIVEKGVIQVPEGRRLFPNMSVEENLLIGSYTPTSRKKRKENMEKVFTLLPRLAERRKQIARTMSGGEQQMLAIGRALMADPKLLMLDEPSLGLAPKMVSHVLELIQNIAAQGVTILLVEQNVYHALKLCNRGYVLENGSITLMGTAEELLNNPHVKKAYLGL